MFKTHRAKVLCSGSCCDPVGARRLADTATFAFDIPREDLALALNQIAQQSHIEIAYSAELTRGKTSPLLKGTYTPEQALKMLLKGSGLHVRRISGGALVIEKIETSPSDGQDQCRAAMRRCKWARSW